MNRYTNVEVSAYNPMTTQEIWAPAAAMRQQHNAADEKLQTQIAELDKVNPLDVHYDKAQKIKSDLLKQIDTQASTLAAEGFNGNTTSGVYKTNRELKSQFSPTGELGQINAAKIAFDTEKANYLEDATKTSKIGREQALRNWEKYAKSKYTGYSEDGKKITNIGALGSPVYQDHDKQLAEMHSLLGSTASSARNKGSQIVQIGGMYALKTSSGGITTDSNINQLNAMKKAYFERWHDPKGEGYQWADAAGIDHNNLRNQDEIIFNSMIKTKRLDETGESYNFLPGQTMNGPKKEPTKEVQGVPDIRAIVIDKNKKLQKDHETYTNYGKENSKPLSRGAIGVGYTASGGGRTPYEQKYSTTNNKDLKRIADGLRQTYPIYKNLKAGSKEEYLAVQQYLKTHSEKAHTNSTSDMFMDPNGQLFPSSNSTERKKAGDLISSRVKNEQAQMFYQDGTKADKGLAGTFELSGYGQAGDVYNIPGANKKSRQLPYRGTVAVKNDDGAIEYRSVIIPRGAQEQKNPIFKGMSDAGIMQTEILENNLPGIYITINKNDLDFTRANGVTDVKVKYNEGSNSYDLRLSVDNPNTGKNEFKSYSFRTDEDSTGEDKLKAFMMKANGAN